MDVTIASDGTVTSVDDQGHAAFTAKLLAGQNARFLEAVRVGDPGEEIMAPSNDNQAGNAEADTSVVVTDPGPSGGGGSKKYTVELPLAVTATKRPTGT